MDKIVNLSVSIDLGEYGKKTFLSYEEMVDYLAQNRIDYTFSNSNVNHSMMLINKFSEIDGKFCLYVKSFKKVIFNNSKLISNIKNFLERDKNNEIKVLIEDNSRTPFVLKNEVNIFFSSLENHLQSGKISLKNVEPSLVKNKFRYMVLGTAYRLSNNGNDSNDYSASVNFNSKESSAILQEHFDRIFKQSPEASWN